MAVVTSYANALLENHKKKGGGLDLRPCITMGLQCHKIGAAHMHLMFSMVQTELCLN